MLTTILCYIANAVCYTFFTSHYSISVAGRCLLILNELSLSFRQWKSGVLPLLPLVFIFVICTVFFEAHCYHVNVEKVKLFLEKESSKRQEKQTYAILHNIPTSVLVLNENKIVFKNR